MLTVLNALHYQIIAFILISMIIFLYAKRVKLNIFREKVFSGLLKCCFVSLILDMAAIVMIYYQDIFGESLVLIMRRIYLISIVFVGVGVLAYTLAEIYQAAAFKKKGRYLYIIPALVSVPLIAHFGVVSVNGDNFGLTVYISMGTVVIYIFTSLVYWAIYHKKMEPQRANAILFTAIIFFVCGVAQLFNQDMRLMSLGTALFMVYMYIGLENPDVYVDGQLGIFNRDAFTVYLSNQIGEGRKVSLLYIFPIQLEVILENVGYTAGTDLTVAIADYLKGIEGAVGFGYNDGSFVLSFEKEEYFFDKVEEIRRRFDETWSINGGGNYEQNKIDLEVSARYIVYPAVRMSSENNAFEVLSTLNYYIDKIRLSDSERYICIDRKQLANIEALSDVNQQLANVVKNGRVEVFYQPVFSIEDNACCELEALVRIRNDKNTYFENGIIIPMAERSGEIINIGYEVFRQICKFMKQNQFADLGIKRVAVNLSLVQCQQNNLAKELENIMNNYDIKASNFRFEISIKTINYMTSSLMRNINYLTSLGAEFAIDDYGNTGIDTKSILTVSKNYIKLGEHAVRDYFSEGKSRLQLQATCKILMQMNFQIAAVGVENQQQYSELKSLGVTHVQGNAFYSPMPEDEIISALQNEDKLDLGHSMRVERII